MNGSSVSLTLDAAVWDVANEQTGTILTTGSTSISTLTANGRTTVTGGGSVQKAVLNSNGCELTMQPTSVELASGVTAKIAGKDVAASTSVSVSPSTLSIDVNNKDAIAFSYEFTFNADKNDLTRVSVNGTTLKAGTYTAELTFEDGSKAAIGLAVSNSAQSAVSPSQITFDKYEQSANYADQTVNVVLPAGTRLDSVKIGSTVLERGTDYTYNATNGTIRLLKETLAKKSKGTYTVTFVPNQGSSFTCSLSVVDTAPVNDVQPSTIDFDANTSSGGYADLVVTLNMVDGAKLKNIRSNGKTLEENWQYKIEGSKVTINKSAVAEFGKSGASYADFVFVMSKGQSPTLRVNYVTTYALTASVVDDLGLPISGASVTFTPSDAESGTAAQTLTTGSDGTATVYVKRGSYVVTATHSRFTAAVTQTVKISAGRTVKLTGEILENVQLVVTNAYGAPLSGAVVTVGGKSITTGTDGTASFSLKRGSYVAQVACTGYSAQSVQLSVTDSIRERVQLK